MNAFLLLWNFSVLDTLRILFLIFSLLFSWDRCIMTCHEVHLFCYTVELDGLTKFFIAARAGFSFILCPLCGVLDGLSLQYFALFRRVPGAMQQACFPSGRLIARLALVFFSRLPVWPVSGLSGQVDSPPFRFLPWLARLASDLIGVLEVAPPSYIFYATSIILNRSHVAL